MKSEEEIRGLFEFFLIYKDVKNPEKQTICVNLLSWILGELNMEIEEAKHLAGQYDLFAKMGYGVPLPEPKKV
jgi:hypothetical protein